MANRNGIITTSKIVKKGPPGIKPRIKVDPMDLAHTLLDMGLLNYLQLTRIYQIEKKDIEKEIIKFLKK